MESTPVKDRKFGLVFTLIFALAAGWAYYASWPPALLKAALVLSILFLLLSLSKPAVLHPLNVLWFQLGQLLGKIVSPIVFGVLFLLIITPVALYQRLIGRDALKIRRKSKRNSYWIERDSTQIKAESFKNQF